MEDITEQPTPARPRTQKQRLAARLNGAKSHGPVTPEGKARSSRNAITHGLLARDIILHGEIPEYFDETNAQIMSRLAPRDEIELAFAETFVVARWRQRRAWELETAGMNAEIEGQRSSSPVLPAVAAWNAWKSLSDGSESLKLLNRYEARHRKEMGQSIRLLHLYRSGLLSGKPELRNEPGNAQPSASSISSGASDLPAPVASHQTEVDTTADVLLRSNPTGRSHSFKINKNLEVGPR
jgi:hypothetical protein